MIVNASSPVISSQCIRVPVTDGHLAAVFVSFENKPSKERILELWKAFEGKPQKLSLAQRAPAVSPVLRGGQPAADEAGPRRGRVQGQPRAAGMGITIGRLRDDSMLDYRFVCLSHNTIRGAAGGAVLTAELLKAEGYLAAK